MSKRCVFGRHDKAVKYWTDDDGKQYASEVCTQCGKTFKTTVEVPHPETSHKEGNGL